MTSYNESDLGIQNSEFAESEFAEPEETAISYQQKPDKESISKKPGDKKQESLQRCRKHFFC